MADLTSAVGFGSDDGSVPPDLAAVLHARARGACGVREVVACLATNRVLVPLLEVDAEQLDDDAGDPCAASSRAVAAVSVQGPDGRSTGLAFSGTAPMARWDPAARPLPVPAPRAAGAVLAEGGRELVVDAGSPHPLRIEGVALARLASGEPWPEPWEDPAVRAAVVAELGPVLASGEIQVRLGEPPEGLAAGLILGVRFAPDLAAPIVARRVAVLADRMSRSARLAEVFDAVLAVQVD